MKGIPNAFTIDPHHPAFEKDVLDLFEAPAGRPPAQAEEELPSGVDLRCARSPSRRRCCLTAGIDRVVHLHLEHRLVRRLGAVRLAWL